jgi:hypothetical protein
MKTTILFSRYEAVWGRRKKVRTVKGEWKLVGERNVLVKLLINCSGKG